MKGKINSYGVLEIKRGKEWKFAECPFKSALHTNERCCGDWCALFGEPEAFTNEETKAKQWWLDLCHRNLIFDEFVDERE